MNLTDKEWELLAALASGELYAEKRGKPEQDRWSIPMELGAWNGSHHSNTLKRLAIKGLALRKYRHLPRIQTPEEIKKPLGGGKGNRGAPKVYRISPEGMALYKQIKEQRK